MIYNYYKQNLIHNYLIKMKIVLNINLGFMQENKFNHNKCLQVVHLLVDLLEQD